MIDGITVLNQTEIMTDPDCFLVVVIVGVILGFALFVLGLRTHNDILVISGLISLLATIVSMPVMLCFAKPSGLYKYEVTIDEPVDFVDMYERYEVIGQRGDIWVLEDKKGE